MHSRGEVRSFLQSAANYWLTEYHFDGLRVDAVSNLLYWQGDVSRGENRAAVQFLQQMNGGLKARHPTAILAAEDSSARPGIKMCIRDSCSPGRRFSAIFSKAYSKAVSMGSLIKFLIRRRPCLLYTSRCV